MAPPRDVRAGRMLVVGAAATALSLAAVLAVPAAASAEDVGDLHLAVVVAAPSSLVSPGEPIQYELKATLTGAPVGSFEVRVTKSGPLAAHPRGLTVAVDLCAMPWSDVGSGAASCASGAEHAFTNGPADDDTAGSPAFALDALSSAQPRYILVTLSVEDSPAARSDASLMGIAADYDLAFTVAGDGVELGGGPSGPLPSTGVDAGGLLAALGIAAAAILTGAATLWRRRRHPGAPS